MSRNLFHTGNPQTTLLKYRRYLNNRVLALPPFVADQPLNTFQPRHLDRLLNACRYSLRNVHRCNYEWLVKEDADYFDDDNGERFWGMAYVNNRLRAGLRMSLYDLLDRPEFSTPLGVEAVLKNITMFVNETGKRFVPFLTDRFYLEVEMQIALDPGSTKLANLM